MVMQLASGMSVSNKFKQLSRWAISCAVGGALVCASMASSATATANATAAKHHRKAAATAHAAPRAKRVATVRRTVTTRTTVRITEIPSQSVGYAAGLHTTDDPLFLRSGAALVLDQDTKEVLYSKNSEAVLPIVSLSTLMVALVISES